MGFLTMPMGGIMSAKLRNFQRSILIQVEKKHTLGITESVWVGSFFFLKKRSIFSLTGLTLK